MDAAGMYAPLSADETADAPPARKVTTKTPIVPVPSDAPEMTFKHPKLGEPTMSWPYRDANGQIVGYVCRWDFLDADGRPAKEVLPVTFCDLGNGRRGWRSKGIPSPRPLYGLPALLANPDRPVLVCEGEKTMDAACDMFPNMVASTPAHGAKSPQLTDFSPLAGRTVIIVPDFDEPGRTDDKGRSLHPGRDFGDKVCELARAAGATQVLRLAPEIFALWMWVDGERVERGEPIPDGWDLADAADEGWTAASAAALLEKMAALPAYLDAAERRAEDLDGAEAEEEGYVWPFRLAWNGVEMRVERVDRETGITTVEWRWFCSIVEIPAETRSADGEEWGRLLLVTDRDERTKPWAMPMAMLAGSERSRA